VLPYLSFACLIFGSIFRYVYLERGWTTKSSEFLAKKSLKWAGPMFHLGLLMAFGGHFVGILVPKFMTEAAGTDEHMYHMMSLMGGIPAGVLFFAGFLLLMARRFGIDRMKVNTDSMDVILYVILFFTIATGCAGTLSNIAGSFDYRESISPWFRSLLMLAPDTSLMADVPFIFRLHMWGWMLTGIVFPFTRLVHCLSFPFDYFLRSKIIYRRK